MLVVLLVAIAVLLGLLLAFDTFALGVGLTSVFGGEGLKRCRACGRLGLSEGGSVHPHGCPEHHFLHHPGHPRGGAAPKGSVPPRIP